MSSRTALVKQKNLLKRINSVWQNFVQNLFGKIGITLTAQHTNIITIITIVILLTIVLLIIKFFSINVVIHKKK